MSLKEKVLKGTVFISVSNMAIRLFSFFTIIMVTRAISVAGYGIFTLFMSLVGPIMAYSSMGLDDVMTADISRAMGEGDWPKVKASIKQFLGMRLLLIIIFLIAAFVFKDWLALKYGQAVINFFWLFVLLVVMQYIRIVYNILFTIYERFTALSLINIAEAFFKFLFIIGFYFLGKLNVGSLIVCYILGSFLAIIVFSFHVAKVLGHLLDVRASKENILYKTLKEHGKWQIVSGIVNSPMSAVKYWLMKALISIEAVGLFALAQNLFAVLASFVPLKDVIFPIIAKKTGDMGFFGRLLQKITKYSLIVHALILLAAELIVVPLIPYVFPKYLLAIPLFQLMAFRLLFNPTSLTQASTLTIFRRQRFIFFCGLLMWLSIFGILPLLLVEFGIFGAVMEIIISLFLLTVVRELYLRKYLDIKTIGFKSFFHVDEIDRMVVGELYAKIKKKLAFRKTDLAKI